MKWRGLEEELESAGDWFKKSTFITFGKEEYQHGDFYSVGRYFPQNRNIGILVYYYFRICSRQET